MLNLKGYTIKAIRPLLLVLTALAVSSVLQAQEKEKITVWSYYESPPFVTSLVGKSGLSFDFVEMLNLFEDNEQYEFILKIIPRKRLDSYLSHNNKGIVLWVNPLFFNDTKKVRYSWTQPILIDKQSFISRVSDPFIYKDATSLMTKGFILGGIRGHIYSGIQKEIDAGLIIRNDVNQEKQNIGMLLTNRVDTFLIPYSTMKYYEKQMKLKEIIYYSPKPLNTYTRGILVNHNKAVFDFLFKTVTTLASNSYWKVLLKQYNLQPPTKKN